MQKKAGTNDLVVNERREMVQGILAYAMSFLTGGLAFLLLFLVRDLLITVLRHSDVSPWAWTAIDNFALIAYVGGWLIGVLVTQHYYREGLRKRLGLSRFLFVTGIVFLLYFLVGAVPGVVGWARYAPTVWVYIALVGASGLAVIVMARMFPPWRSIMRSGRT